MPKSGNYCGNAPRLRLALEAGQIGTWHWDLATGRMAWSAQMFRNLGLSPGSAGDLYALLIEAVHPSEREFADTSFRKFAMRPGPLRIELRLVWPGEEPHWVVFLGRVIGGRGGRSGEMLGITIDSTRRQKSEEAAATALRESEKRLREVNEALARRAERRARQLGASRAQMQAIYDNSPDWLTLFRATADGRFVYEDLNRATEIAYGLDREQVVGRLSERSRGRSKTIAPVAVTAEMPRLRLATRLAEPAIYRSALDGRRHPFDRCHVRSGTRAARRRLSDHGDGPRYHRAGGH